ncbi:heterokaryon incompatibility protein-domain-containing protein [Trametes gibbosa]|nr:heterokaryon incompatibility protein-domain-containing protein [Trametes gibbosa]
MGRMRRIHSHPNYSQICGRNQSISITNLSLLRPVARKQTPMPRFLDTYTGEFVWLTYVGITPYAILSHTWCDEEEGGEQTYDDIVQFQSAFSPSTPGYSHTSYPPPPLNEAFFSHPELSAKIKGICKVARRAGYRLIWIDSCCIDKRSSAELSEAINAMYALYRDSNICFVYLADVPDGTVPRATDSDFWKSRWYKRGWTLQELIAPARVMFLSSGWTFLGTKTGLASTLEKITGVSAAILTGRVPLSSASVAKRMSWAAERATKRVEDQAYSLLGIFGVHLSPIYGEGTNAFLRLQEEIIKHIPDQSIFAWGKSRTLVTHNWVSETYHGLGNVVGPGLLASSPIAFYGVGDVTPIAATEFSGAIGMPRSFVPPPLHCVFTPQGVRISLMHISLALLPETTQALLKCDMFSHFSRDPVMTHLAPRVLVLLRCEDQDGNVIALPLHCPEQDVGRAENVSVGVRARSSNIDCYDPTRVVRVPKKVLERFDVTAAYIELSILRHHEEPLGPRLKRTRFSIENGIALWDVPPGERAIFQHSPDCEEELRAVGFAVTPLECRWSHSEVTLATTLRSAAREHLSRQPEGSTDILIQLRLYPEKYGLDAAACFSVDRPATLSISGSPSAADDSGFKQSIISRVSSSTCTRVLVEAEFVIPADDSDDQMDVHGVVKVDEYVRLLRLSLLRPMQSAYVVGCKDILFSVELSEPLIAGEIAEPAVVVDQVVKYHPQPDPPPRHLRRQL